MKQTIREQLQIIIDAMDAGETEAHLVTKNQSRTLTEELNAALYWVLNGECEISRIPKPPETISGAYADGTKWEINAPMREAPADGYLAGTNEGD